MPIERITCDRCGVKTDRFTEDYDRRVLCVKCDLTVELDHARNSYDKAKEWIESTWLSDLRKKKQKIEELEAALAKESNPET